MVVVAGWILPAWGLGARYVSGLSVGFETADNVDASAPEGANASRGAEAVK